MKRVLLAALIVLAMGVFMSQNFEKEERIREEAMQRAERHAAIYSTLAKCLDGDVTLTVAGEPVTQCVKVKR